MARIRVARFSAEQLRDVFLDVGQVVLNTTTNKLHFGDGVSPDGFVPEIDPEIIGAFIQGAIDRLTLESVSWLEPLLEQYANTEDFGPLRDQVDAKVGESFFIDFQETVINTPTKELVDSLSASLTDLADKTEVDRALAGKIDAVGFMHNGIILAERLPAAIDEVHEYPSLSGFPSEGLKGRIYIATDTALIYRWSGTQYVGLAIQVEQEFASVEELHVGVATAKLFDPETLGGFLPSLGFFKSGDQWELDGGEVNEPGFVANSGPGPEYLIHGDKKDGFFGIVPNAEMISVIDLYSQTEMGVGTVSNTGTDWLKFIQDGIVKFMPLKTIRSGISWSQLYELGLVYGVDDVGAFPTAKPTKQDAKVLYHDGAKTTFFKVRLPSLGVTDPLVAATASTLVGSEWERLIKHFVVPVTPDVESWGELTPNDLGLGSGSGQISYAYGMNTAPSNTAAAIRNELLSSIGANKDASGGTSTRNRYQWRPLLEVIPPEKIDFVMSIRKVEGNSTVMPDYTEVRFVAPNDADRVQRITDVMHASMGAEVTSVKSPYVEDGLTLRDSYYRKLDELNYTRLLHIMNE